jgi:hypothetical protein
VELIADILLIAGALGASGYCIVLSRRLRRFADVETGVGGAIAALSLQVDQMTAAIGQAQTLAENSSQSLDSLTNRAEDVARRLELLVAAMHDITESEPAARTVEPPTRAALFQSRRPTHREAAE